MLQTSGWSRTLPMSTFKQRLLIRLCVRACLTYMWCFLRELLCCWGSDHRAHPRSRRQLLLCKQSLGARGAREQQPESQVERGEEVDRSVLRGEMVRDARVARESYGTPVRIRRARTRYGWRSASLLATIIPMLINAEIVYMAPSARRAPYQVSMAPDECAIVCLLDGQRMCCTTQLAPKTCIRCVWSHSCKSVFHSYVRELSNTLSEEESVQVSRF